MTDRSREELNAEIGARARKVAGTIRRFAVTLTSRPFWQVVGHLLVDGKTRETWDAEVFSGVGFYARPPADGKPEAIAVFVGGGGAPIVVATRDEATRQAVFKLAGELGAGDAAMFSPAAVVIARANGTVEIRTPSGSAAPLATKADLATLKLAIENAVVVANDGGASLQETIVAALDLAMWPSGTTVLKAE